MDIEKIKQLLINIGEMVCDEVQILLREQAVEQRTQVHHQSKSDTIYQIDHDVEQAIIPVIAEHAESLGGIVLIAEGIGEDEVTVYPEDIQFEDASIRIIMDPIDGTRGLMYDKRSAFFLAGAAPNKGDETCLKDIAVSVMVEIPTSRCYSSDTLWAVKGCGAEAYRRRLDTGDKKDIVLVPSSEKSIYGGFASVSRFFSPGKDVLGAMEEQLLATLFPDARSDEILTFEDQYISSGGQLYEMLTGKDRFIADVRGSLFSKFRKLGDRTGHACHPYDVCAHMIGTEAGLVITDGEGEPLNCLLDTTTPVDWIGYANGDIYKEVAPIFGEIMRSYQLI